MTNPWFRFYSETLRDRKLERIARVTKHPKALLVGVWATLLALANDSPERGVLLLTEDIPLAIGDLCLETDLGEDELHPILDRFIAMEMLSFDGEVYFITNWGKRQFKSDNSTERVRKWRERQAAKQKPNNGNNNDVTLQGRSSNAPDTDTDTEEDKRHGDVPSPPEPETERKPSAKDQVRGDLEQHFADKTGLPKPKANTAKQRREAGSLWWGPLREIAELCQWDGDLAIRLIDATLAHLNGQVTIASPKSIIKTARAVYTGNAPGAPKFARDGPPERPMELVEDPDNPGKFLAREVAA